MRKNLLTAFCICATLSISSLANAQSILIHYWNFNTFTTSITLPATADLSADYTRVASPTAALTYVPIPGTSAAFSDYCDDVAGDASDTINARLGAPAGNAFRARNPSDSMQILLYIPSSNYQNLQLKYACESSSYTSGDSINVFAYSVDSGHTWISSGAGLSEWIDSGSLGFRLVSVHINDTNANNNPKLVFRITTMGRNSGSSGNNRYDNITLDGDTCLTCHTVDTMHNNAVNNVPSAQPVSYSLYPNPAYSSVSIEASLDGQKEVEVYSLVGQKVFAASFNGTKTEISVAGLVAGTYFIHVRDYNTGSVSNLQFVKE